MPDALPASEDAAPRSVRRRQVCVGGSETASKMEAMLHRLKPPILVTIAAVVLACVAVATLRDAAPQIVAATIVLLAMVAGIGVGASVASPRHR